VTGLEIRVPGQKVRHPTVNGIVMGGGVPSAFKGKAGGVSHDPMSIEIFDLDTGVLFLEQLFTLDADWNQFGVYAWNTGGILLEAPADGVSSASINGGFASDWLSASTGMFSASLANGIFGATGAFAGLPWVLTLDGADVVRATLDAAFVPDLFGEYQVPAALVADDHQYQQTLILSKRDGVAIRVAEPSIFLLMMMGLVLFGRTKLSTVTGWRSSARSCIDHRNAPRF
jgi:hypothetical protein